jgi:uncharacterized protein with HEPN domain
MTQDGIAVLLEQMLLAAQRAVSYVEGMSKAEFLADHRTQEAVSLNLILIGEIANRLSRTHSRFAAAHPSLPLRQMQGMRNRIAHGYIEINMDIVWETVAASLPELTCTLPSIIQSVRDARLGSSGDA